MKSDLININYFFLLVTLIFFEGCASPPHEDFIKDRNEQIGYNVHPNIKPYKFKGAGEIYRSDFAVRGQGLTHITKDKNGNKILHWSYGEVLYTLGDKDERVGKCLTYQVVDSKTSTVLEWGFDKGGNPKSCIAWWP